ncbi:retropepsin-like aspartic protease [Dokdonia sp.]|uniref:retropepsin-like aspartic protease n=1 Tax=Dokdonia sp. TaxID=2024995 RepID=UPI003262E5A2
MKYNILFLLHFCILFFSFPILAQDTIPITIGNDNRIYLKASVNGSEALDFIFDTGASAMVANTTMTDKKLQLTYGSTIENIGANGVSTQRVSAGNTLRIGRFERKNEELIGIAYPKEHYSFDGVIGYPFFEDYLMEIDYASQRIVIHTSEKTIANPNTFEKISLQFMGDLFYMDMTVFKKETPATFPVMIDTGYNGDLIVYHKIVSQKGLADQFQNLGSSQSEGTDGTIMRSDEVMIPKAMFANILVENINANLNKTPATIDFTAIVGGAIMKDFHWIFDFKKRLLYIKSR